MKLADLGNWTTKLGMVLPSVGAMYVKRLLEDPYDRLATTATFAKIKDLDSRSKGAIEFVGYVLTAIADLKLTDNTPLRHFLKDIGVDFAPEMAKRMVNGKKIRAALATAVVNSDSQGLLTTLLEIEDDTQLSDLISWIFNQGPEHWSVAAERLGQLPREKFLRFVELDPETRRQILEILKPPAAAESSAAQTAPIEAKNELRSRIRGLTEKIRQETEKLGERSK